MFGKESKVFEFAGIVPTPTPVFRTRVHAYTVEYYIYGAVVLVSVFDFDTDSVAGPRIHLEADSSR